MVHPVQFGALPAAAEQLFTKPRPQPKIEPNFEERPQNFVRTRGLVHSPVSGRPQFSKPPLFGHGRG